MHRLETELNSAKAIIRELSSDDRGTEDAFRTAMEKRSRELAAFQKVRKERKERRRGGE